MSTEVAESTLKAIAERLVRAREFAAPIPPIRDELPAMDVEAAYRIQQMNTRQRITGGERIVGRKIGLTSLAVQQQLGVDRPDFGMLFDTMAHHGDDVIVRRVGLIAPRIEAEIAFKLSRDIVSSVQNDSDLADVIAGVAAAAEIVDSAIADWKIGIVDTIADNASSGAFAVGSLQPFEGDVTLPALRMRLLKDDEVRSTGTGAATLGNPLTALRWLANQAISFGDPLRKDDIILSGALGAMIPFEIGTYRIEIERFPPLIVNAVP